MPIIYLFKPKIPQRPQRQFINCWKVTGKVEAQSVAVRPYIIFILSLHFNQRKSEMTFNNHSSQSR